MFSYKLIEKKINKNTKPHPAIETTGKRKRRTGKTAPGLDSTKKQCIDSDTVLLNPDKKIDINKNKISKPEVSRKTRNGRKNVRKKKGVERQGPDDTPTHARVPILYAQSRENRYLCSDSESDMSAGVSEDVDGSSVMGYFDGRKGRRNTEAGMGESSDSECKFDAWKDGLNTNAGVEQSSDSECSFDARKDKNSKMENKSKESGCQDVDQTSDLEHSVESGKHKRKNSKKDKNLNSGQKGLDQTSDLEHSVVSRKNKNTRKNRNLDQTSDSEHSVVSRKNKNTRKNRNLDQTSDSEHSVVSRKNKNTRKNRNLDQTSDSEHSVVSRKNKNTRKSKNLDQTSDSEHSADSRKNKNTRRNKTTETHAENLAQKLVGECISVTKTEGNTVVAALAPDTTLYLQGCVVVRPLLGSVEVLGYTLQQGQSQSVYSLPSSSLLGITALEGCDLDPKESSVQGLPASWLESLAQEKMQMVLVEVQKHSSPRVDFLGSVGWGSLRGGYEWQKHWHSVGTSIVTRNNCHRHRVTHIPPQWRNVVETVVMNFKCGAVPRVVIGGGKGVGKSTFFKYLANSLLSAKPGGSVLCLDFDPGQPELSLPTSLSLTHLTQPLLGPAYTHDLQSLSTHHKHILVGSVTPQFVLEEYVMAVRELCKEAGVTSDAPLLVNTMGWTQGTGLGLMVDIVRLVAPTHLIQIEDDRRSRNFPFPLTSEAVSKARGGITTKPGQELYYNLTVLPSAGQGPSAPHMAQPRVLRELRVLAEAGMTMEFGQRVSLPWSSLALHVCEEQVPRDRILQALNAQLVGLCRVDPASLHTLHKDLPHLLTPHAGFGTLLGWGVVMGVDPHNNTIQLGTTLSQQEVTQEVNAIVMPRIHLTAPFYKLFCTGNGPYIETASREGAGRLRVGRRIKPRGYKD